MFSQDRTALRRVYIDAWRKAQAGEPLQPLEQQLTEIIQRHPEYHGLLDAGVDALDRDWLPEQGESNPFLHMSLHSAVLEQVTADRPPGIRALYQRMIQHCLGDVHEAEHRLMDCLAEIMWRAQRDGREPDPAALLRCINSRCGGNRFGS